ncbi:hypothetical protein ACFOKF_16475 [Sphingobium rhizovicinum]|uniref:Zinc-binding domain-containing protein n=1 Tax=Sphingobium rhizovicinum TaxID=432308 RepID=A0ABV7NKF1_9SPHN
MLKFDIREMATPGTVLEIDRQKFFLTALEPYTRKDGSASYIVHWEAECARCGEAFEDLTGLTGRFPRRRCETCRKVARGRITKRGKRVQIRVIPA